MGPDITPDDVAKQIKFYRPKEINIVLSDWGPNLNRISIYANTVINCYIRKDIDPLYFCGGLIGKLQGYAVEFRTDIKLE